jgi:PAS domain S-box-containing protein
MNDKTNPLQNFETEELLRFLEEGFLLTDLEGNILSLNNAGSSVFGYGNALELVGKNFRDLFWKTEDFGTFLDTIKKTGEIQEYLIFGRKRDGRPAYIQAYSRLHPVNAEKPEAIATLFKDVSERELFKRALERSEDRYRTLFNSISEGYVRFNADNQVVFINAAGAKILGFETPMAVLGQQIMDLWQDPMAWVDFKDRLTTRGELSGEHVELELRNGRRVTLEITERIVRNRDGQVVGSDALFKDITEQHALQERLVESAQKLHEIVSSCAEMMLVADTAGKITFVNNAYQAIFGYSVEDAVGKQLGYATFLEDRERLEAAMREVLQGRPVSSLDLRVFRKDGTEVMTSWSASALRDVAGRVKGIIAIGRDVTERRRVEAEIRRERDFSMSIIQTSPAFFVAIDRDGKLLMMNKAMLNALGYAAEEVIGKEYLPLFVPERERAAVATIFAGLTRGQTTLNENHVLTREGRELLVEWHGAPVFDADGNLTHFFGIGIDRTERRKAEDALRESERFLSSIFASIQDGISILDKDYKIVAVNPTMEKWYAHAMPLVGKKCYAAYHLRKEICAPCPSRSVLETGKASREIVPRIGEGRKITGWVDLFSFPMFDTTTGALKGVIEYVRDITERVEAEKRLQFMSRAIEQTTEGIGIADLNGNILFINRAAAAMAGYTAEELIGKNLSLLHNAEQIPATEAARKQVIETGEFTGEIWHIRRDGTPFLALMRNSLIRNEASQPFGVIATVRDITEAKRADTALRKEKEFSERLIENANNIILTLDLEGRITTFNRFAEELTGYSRSEVIGKNYFDMFIPEKERKEQVEGFRAFIKGSPPMTDLSTIVCKDGVKRVIMWTSSLLNTADGSITGSLSIGKDMTERPLADFRPREEHDFSKAMLDTSAALMLVADREGRVAKINEAMTKLTGFTEEEIKGRTLWETIIPRGNEKESRERYAALFREAKHALVERTILNKAGEVRYVIWCNDFIRNEAGNPCYMVSVGTDFTETMELRRRIERSEKMYQSVVDNSPDIILRADTSGKITFVGGGGRQLTGYADEDALGKSIGEFLHPADRKEVEAAFMRAASGEIVENVVGRAVTKNGGILHLSNSARAIRNERGEVAEVQITSRDISPLVRLQEQLRRHSEDLEELVEKRTIALRDALQKRAEEELYSAKLQQLAPLAFIGTDENMLIRTWNTPAEKMFGYATEEVIGKSPAILVAPEKMNDFNFHMAAGMRGETVRGSESVGITKDGRRIDVKLDLMLLLDEKGRKIRGLGLVEDITQQKAAQRALEEARKRLQIVLEEIPEYGIFSTDANFVITYFGPGCENLTGWKAHEVVGIKDAHILKPSAESTPRTRPLHEAFLSGAPASEPVTIMRKDGSTAEVSAVVKPILDKNGVAQGIIGVLRDISKERDLVGRLFEDARYKALGAIIAGISAELNGTLNRLEQHAALAKEDAGFAKRLSASVREEVRRTRALIGNLTRFTRPASQPFQLLNPAKVTDEVAQMLQGEFERAGVRMVKTYHHVADTLMRADDVQHALLNLILAAMTNAGKGGSVEIIVQQDDAIITLTVKDNGQGMEASDIYRAFEPPFWLEASTSRQEKGLSAGMGLGLISAKKTAEDHGGTVEIESESGVGTTVRIKLPVKTVRRGRKTTKIIAAAQPMPNQLPLRILVADDETHIRSVIAYIAKEKSHLCETATALAEVRNLCAERKFDVALIDEGLGSETDLAAAIAAVKGSSPKARVYLLTEGTAESAAGRLEHLVDGALTHTFSVEDIQRLLGR